MLNELNEMSSWQWWNLRDLNERPVPLLIIAHWMQFPDLQCEMAVCVLWNVACEWETHTRAHTHPHIKGFDLYDVCETHFPLGFQ